MPFKVSQKNNKFLKSLTAELWKASDRNQPSYRTYRLLPTGTQNQIFEPGTVEVSREWLNALLKSLVKSQILPERIEVKDPFQLAVLKSLL